MIPVTDESKTVGVRRITDEDLISSGPAVRALLVARLEQLWKPVERALEADNAGLMPADPRLLEFGRQVVKDEAALYRLARPPVVAEVEEEVLGEGVDRRALVESRLQEIEQKLRETRS